MPIPMEIHNPLPSSMESECKKCGKILASFIDPRQVLGPDRVIPPTVLANAEGLAIITVLKAGFLGSARYGNGVVVARLPDGTWSAPSAIGLGGAGFGGQIGIELTDFVFVLNDAAAVRSFSQQGNLTLGGNVSLAAGPVGRNMEAAGAASLKGVAGVFSYSKTKGLFAGVSLEGSAIIERRDANEKLYGQRYKASELLTGSVRPPSAAASLMNVLNSRVFAGISGVDDASGSDDDYTYSDRPTSFSEKPGSGRLAAPKPALASKASSLKELAVALFTFEADQPGDLGFKKGDIITVTTKTGKAEDWWTGRIGTRVGIFPSNYVKTKEN